MYADLNPEACAAAARRLTAFSVFTGPVYTTQYPPRSGLRFDEFAMETAPRPRACRATAAAAARPRGTGMEARMTIQPCTRCLCAPGVPRTRRFGSVRTAGWAGALGVLGAAVPCITNGSRPPPPGAISGSRLGRFWSAKGSLALPLGRRICAGFFCGEGPGTGAPADDVAAAFDEALCPNSFRM